MQICNLVVGDLWCRQVITSPAAGLQVQHAQRVADRHVLRGLFQPLNLQWLVLFTSMHASSQQLIATALRQPDTSLSPLRICSLVSPY